ncbi:Tat pathway signal protein [Actinoplanes sp. ATCC 53533]|uniref:Tat pathway signal protein n=1 Tax=Actinoplanes sp. ATCC 53533 TaxID=1288362 RepID=UPI000F7B771E|nr:Tat pathway signal protein [Actinoplanes sp. ATCC 53533]RSM64674.1 Tat pathway signal protein [Actinoplanes sp. ATCC 53533]
MRIPFPRSGPPRVVAATTAIALATAVIGWLVGTHVRSPADAAAAHRAPPASLVTVAVTERELTATVNAQGTVAYGAPQPIALTGSVATGDAAATGAPLVTKAPSANKTLREGDVLLEVSGRPVFVLTGKVPMYRTLTRGSSGDDVDQLRSALRRLRPGSGLAATGVINDSVLDAVRAWYTARGYQAQGPTAEQKARLRTLQQAVSAGTGPALKDAEADLNDFTKTYGTSIASGEILFLPKLPLRLTAVTVQAGAAASGVIGTASDPTLVVNGTVAPDDAALLKAGMPATLTHPDGETFAAKLAGMGASVAVTAAADKSDGTDGTDSTDSALAGVPIRLKPAYPGKLAAFAGQAFKVSIEVGGTGHAVLSVPVAAVYTAADGQSRVTVQDATGSVHDVPVTAGLSTAGFVQITPKTPDSVRAGSRVVVGTQ